MIVSASHQPGLVKSDAQPCRAHDGRVLVLAPKGEEAEILCAALSEYGIDATNCPRVEELCHGIERGAGAAIVAGESLAELLSNCLTQVLSRQLPWSDFPLIVLTGGGISLKASWRALGAMEPDANAILLERPVSTLTLLTTVRAALRSRRRQYELRDLAGRRRAEENLLKEKSFSDAAINSLPGIFYVLDAEGHNLRWNKAFEEVTGYSAGEIARMHPTEFVPEEYKQLIVEKMREVVKHGQA